MSQEKAQLIAPLGHFTVPGLNVSGVVTATSFSGNCTGTASSIVKGTNVVVGVMTASSFVGDVTGNVTGIGSNTDNLDVGVVTATSFAGNFTGIGSGLTGTPNVVAGVVTATKFVGNTPGTVSKLADGTNINVGVVTATKFVGNTSGLAAGIAAAQNINVGVLTATGGLYGDGSGLTGAGSTAYIRQSVSSATTTLGGATTNINLNDGNIINFEHVGSPTLSFFNAKTADDITIIRSLTDPTNHSFDDGAVDFDGSGDYLSLANDSDLQPGSGDFTFEAWIYPDSWDSSNYDGIYVTGATDGIWLGNSAGNWVVRAYGVTNYISVTNIPTGQWSHVAVTRSGSTLRLFFDGVLQSSVSNTKDFSATSAQTIGSDGSGADFDGKISNLRFVKGTAVYTSNFSPPTEALTNITNTKLLCCQDTSSTTVGAVKPGTITANGDPTASSQTITWKTSLGSELTWTGVTWNGGSAPTLVSSNSEYTDSSQAQVFNLVTADGGSTWYGYQEASTKKLIMGQLWVWGDNEYGALGQNNLTNYSSPVQIPGTTWSQASVHGESTSAIAVKKDGTLWSWGYNSNGALGQNQALSTNLSSPAQIGSGTDWEFSKRYALGGLLSKMAMKTDGTLWSWGSNEYGQLGQNSRTYYSSPVQIPGTWNNCTAGTNQFVGAGVKTDGTAWIWGRNTYGLLGLSQSTPTQRSSPTQIPGTTWSRLVTPDSWYQVMVTKTDGTLWAWGSNYDGGLGMSDIPAGTYRSSPIQIPGTNWSDEIVGGLKNWLAVKTDGTLWTWGENASGQLGQNQAPAQLSAASSPIQIPGTTWSQVGKLGHNSCMALKTDGTLWSWGYNYDGVRAGVLGLNDRTTRSSPTQIPGTTWVKIFGGNSRGFALKT